METVYIPGDFAAFIREQGDNATLRSIDGHQRWVISNSDQEFIARPIEAETHE